MDKLWQTLLAHDFMPHGHCYLWQPALVWLQVLTNGAIGVAYVVISCLLAGLVYKIRDDLPFRNVYLAFGTFIVSCGITHFCDILVIWTPVYWLDGLVRAVTAVASVGTALMLPPLLPRIRDLARGARAAVARGIALETAVRDLEAMYRKSQSVERLKSKFFANVSHELRTPLTLILGPLEALAQRTDLPADAQEHLAMAQRNARILLRQVGDILDSAKLEAGMTPLLRSHVNTAALVRQICDSFMPLARDRNIQFSVDAPQQLAAYIDGDKLERVLLNLLSNAFKHAPEGGQVVCILQQVGHSLQLEVRNSGASIPPAARLRIFERFAQADDAEALRGTGLGLAIVRDYVHLHQGSVEVTDAPEGGARFIIVLPLRHDAETQESVTEHVPSQTQPYLDALRIQEPNAMDGSEAESDRPRLLLAEDNAELNRFLRMQLRGLYIVDVAHDGTEALAKAKANPPDLIISDWTMPGLSGEQLLAAVRADPVLGATPFLLITARNSEADRVAMLERGAHDYLAKPFQLSELLARVSNLVSLKRTRDVLLRSHDFAPYQGNLEQLATAVQRRTEVLEQEKLQAQALARAKADFVNMVSHELRSPLAAMGLQVARLLRQSGLPETAKKIAIQLEGGAQRLGRLLDALLLHSRAEVGALCVQSEDVVLSELVEEVVQELTPLAVQQHLAVHNLAARDCTLRTDATLMRVIVRNLLSNAIKFTQPGGWVEISSRTEDGKTILIVRDNGPGIRSEDHTQVFEPFVHLEPVANKHTPGMGLGLSLVRTMTQALGGHVELSSQEGTGATFKIVLG